MSLLKKMGIVVIALVLVLGCFILVFSQKAEPAEIHYGMSFNTPYARELGLNWQEVYDAMLGDLGVRKLRLAAHWPMVEPAPDQFNFTELDYQIAQAEAYGAEVILAVGRRLPRWPECHVPEWAKALSVTERDEAQLRYMEQVVTRYRNSPAIKYWQIENEPFLKAFAFEHCGELNVEFLEKEIAFVRELDPGRPLLVTDSGNLGLWAGAYKRGDAFGTSVYVYFWNPELGQFKTALPPAAYRFKENMMALLYGHKPTFLIELSAEPWLVEPIANVPLPVQFSRMDIEKFKTILAYAKETRFDQQYLWGVEWWYWLAKAGHPEFWDHGKTLFTASSTQERLE
jgi:Cellulase (glycosyl hydrolase family 5)